MTIHHTIMMLKLNELIEVHFEQLTRGDAWQRCKDVVANRRLTGLSLKAYLTDTARNLNAFNVKCFFQDIPARCQNYLHSKLTGNGFNLNNETSTDGEGGTGGEYNKRSEGRGGHKNSKTCLNNTDDETYDDMSNTYSQNCGGRRSADCSSSCESQASSQANDAVIYNSGAESVYNDSILSESASVTRTAPTPPPAPPPPPVPQKSSSRRRHESPRRPPSIRRQHKTIHEDDEEAVEEIDEVDMTGRERDRDEEEEMEYKRNLSKDDEDDDDDDEEDERYGDKQRQQQREEESSDQDNEEEEAAPSKMSYNKYKNRPQYQRQF